MALSMPLTTTTTTSSDLLIGLDRLAFARRAGIEPDKWQVDVLRSEAPGILLNCSRQSGKSHVGALIGAWTALYDPGPVLCVSRIQGQAQLLFRSLVNIWQRVGEPVPADAESRMYLELRNGSRVAALPGAEESIRGWSAVKLLLIDEASRVPDPLYRALRPMLATSAGRQIAMSTPFGKRGWWYEAIQDRAQSGWLYVELPAEDCPRISPEFLAEERRTMGYWWYEQEYGCRFLDAQAQVFRSEDIEAAFAEPYATWDLGLDPVPEPEPATPQDGATWETWDLSGGDDAAPSCP
jgi:Terminase large subunit, T4likevirus-type, N-terminal